MNETLKTISVLIATIFLTIVLGIWVLSGAPMLIHELVVPIIKSSQQNSDRVVIADIIAKLDQYKERPSADLANTIIHKVDRFNVNKLPSAYRQKVYDLKNNIYAMAEN